MEWIDLAVRGGWHVGCNDMEARPGAAPMTTLLRACEALLIVTRLGDPSMTNNQRKRYPS